MGLARRVRELTQEEVKALQAGLRSSSAITVRRCQILLLSDGQALTPQQIAANLHCSDQCVRNTIHVFEREGLNCLNPKSRRPLTVVSAFTQATLERLTNIVHSSPRLYGYPTSFWSLERLAEVSFTQGLTTELVCYETIRNALKRLGIDWRRAKPHITSPDPHYEQKKST
jgi:transposase